MLYSKSVQRNCLHFFKKILKTVCALRVNETKLTSKNTLIFNLFASESEKNKKRTKEASFGAPRRVLNWLLTLVSERRLLAFFWNTLVLAIFQTLPLAFRKKRLNSLSSALNSTWKKPSFCRVSVLVCCCAANQYRKIAWIFSKIFKNSARSKG